jgi:hypothetical protein
MAGIYFIKKKEFPRELLFLTVWILLAPLASALLGPAHALRSSFLLPPLLIVSAVGGSQLLNRREDKGRRLLPVFILGIFFMQFVFLVERLYFVSPNKFANFWSYPAKKASEIAIAQRDKFDAVIISTAIDNIEYAYPVYARLNPEDVIGANKEKSPLAGLTLKRFGNVYLGTLTRENLDTLEAKLDGSVLFITRYDFEIKPTETYDTVLSLDRTPAILIIRQ